MSSTQVLSVDFGVRAELNSCSITVCPGQAVLSLKVHLLPCKVEFVELFRILNGIIRLNKWKLLLLIGVLYSLLILKELLAHDFDKVEGKKIHP